MAMALRLEVYCGGNRAKPDGERTGSGKFKKQNKKGTVATVQGNKAQETVQLIQSQQKKQGKSKGRQGQKKKGNLGG